MFIRHSLKNVFRSWKKSILFFFLIVMLVMILCIGVSLTVTIRDFLNDCEKSFTTVAAFEYMGAAYPDETVYDPNLEASYDTFDSAAIEANPYVEEWDSNAVALGYIDRIPGFNYLAPYQDNAVIVVHIIGSDDSGTIYSSTVSEVLYSYRDTQGYTVYIDSAGKKLEAGHYYLLHGEFYLGYTSYKYIRLAPYINSTAKSTGFDGSIDRMLVDITTEDGGYNIPPDSYFQDIADTYGVINSSITVHATNDLEALFPFQQDTLYLVDGRSFTGQDYSSGAPVCVISEGLAKSLNIKLGDQVNLSLAVQSGCIRNESYWAGSGFAYTGSYTVIGLTNIQRDLKNDVFIPKTSAVDLSANHFQYTLGQAKLRNDKADRFVTEITPLLPDRIRMTVYDQGYAAIAKPLNDVLRVAVFVTCVCAVVCLALAFLFGFLFVYRQRDTARNMRRLGAGKRNIFCYFLFGSGCISLISVIAGTAASIRMSAWCMELVRKLVASYAADDLRYSNGNLSMVKAIEFVPEINRGVLLLTGMVVFLLTLCSCCLFANLRINAHLHRHRMLLTHGGAASGSLHGGPFKYAWLSVKRGGLRTLIPILVSGCTVILLFQLTYTTVTYNNRLEELNRSTEIKGYFTDIHGKQASGLSVDGIAVRDLASSGYLTDINVTKEGHYYYLSKSAVNEKPAEAPEFELPTSSFAMETFMYNLVHGSGIIYTNNLSYVPEFYFSSTIITDFLEGYDTSVFSREIDGFPCCIVSTAFMEGIGLHLGDTIRLLVYNDDNSDYVDLLVVGSYVKAGGADNIYCQLGSFVSPKALLDKNTEENLLRNYTFSSIHFKLVGGEELDNLKNYLSDKGYSEVNKIHSIRNFITIEDKSFLITQSAMRQRIWYINRTFPILYILVELLAGLIPYILIQLRKRELAIMRGQGTSKRTVFGNMFLEQAILIVMGVMIGLLVSQVFFMKYSGTGFILTGIFTLSWFLGTICSIHQINRCSVQSILKAEE